MKKSRIFILGLVASLLFSCAPRIVGTWTVQKYQTTTPGEESTTLINVGTMTFNKNNTGEKQLDYSVLGMQKTDNAPFEWSSSERFITIVGDNTELSKTWLRIEDKRKFQKLQSTDGANTVQTLELSK
ncbi:hypothetical protein ACFQZJ_13095 [Maribacter chungangensis]|uniref:Lipocalin family protein n=1 Tax=Maribacter chungangensis TaxID=1069117 RepID=A0ABW3B5Q4_9FLAO